jgi:hypothetical protein
MIKWAIAYFSFLGIAPDHQPKLVDNKSATSKNLPHFHLVVSPTSKKEWY